MLSARTSFALLTTEFAPQTRTIAFIWHKCSKRHAAGTSPTHNGVYFKTLSFIGRATDEKCRAFPKLVIQPHSL